MAATVDGRMMKMTIRRGLGVGAVAGVVVVELSLLACSGTKSGTGALPAAQASPQRPAMERNADCCMCHQPFLAEPLSVKHAKHEIA